ncbi:MAG: serine/threonine-protein kinase, partial [Pseudomonadota bacterium]
MGVEACHVAAETLVDHFKVVRPLGRGGMGEVYLARDTVLGRRVALKLIQPGELDSDEARSRFLREARITASFNHPHIVTVYAVGEYEGRPYLALEYVEGETLRARMQQQRLAEREAARIGLAIAKALAEAHRRQILHRDLKPENVVLAKDGCIRVLDFGIARAMRDAAKAMGASAEFSAIDCEERADGEATEPRFVCGTPAYLAPECWLGKPDSEATDIWSLGVVLYEMLGCRRPYADFAPDALRVVVASSDPTPSLRSVARQIPAELSDLVDRCLEKDPSQRPVAAAIAESLENMLLAGRRQLGAEECPFRGLLSFQERHSDLFFGRESEVAAFLEAVREQAVLPVVGPSGAGKSSFVQAGVVPRLREQGSWTVLSIRPGGDPFAALAARLRQGDVTSGTWTSIQRTEHTALTAASVLARMDRSAVFTPTRGDRTLNAPPAGTGLGPIGLGPELGSGSTPAGEDGGTPAIAACAKPLAEQIRESPRLLGILLHQEAADSGSKILLFVDQMEEVYTLVDDADTRRRFMEAVCSAAEDPSDPVRVVLTIRDDFLIRVAEGTEAINALSRMIVMRRPGLEMLRNVLLRPVEAAGYRYEDPALIEEMIAAVRDEQACLPLLQFAGTMLWERRDRERRLLTRSAHQAMGGVTGALVEYADGVLAGLSPDQVAQARELLLRLVTPEGTRKVLPLQAAVDGLGSAVEEVLSRLVQARLLVMRRGRGDGPREAAVIELVHESLITKWDRLAQWLEESKEELQALAEVSQAAALWDRRGQRAVEVWEGEALHDAARKLARLPSRPPAVVQMFLAAGQRRERHRVLRRRLLAGIGVAILAVITLVAVLVARQTRRQKDQAETQRAEAQVQGARAALLREDLLEARAQLRSSLETHDSALARALWWRLANDPMMRRFSIPGVANDIAISPSSGEIAVASADKRVYLFDVSTRMVRTLRGHDSAVRAVAYSPDGRLLAAGTDTGPLFLWDLASGTSRRLEGHSKSIYGLAFHPSSSLLASGGLCNTVRLWD